MSNYTTEAQLSNLQEVGRATARYILNASVSDREKIFTNWVDMLIEGGLASSLNNACVRIAKSLGIKRSVVHSYYKGVKNV